MFSIEEFNDFLSKRIAQLRMAKGVSARDMSLTLGQGAGYINSIENKNSLPSMPVFYYVCEYLGITPRDFFDVDLKNPALLQDAVDALKTLNDEDITLVLANIKRLQKS